MMQKKYNENERQNKLSTEGKLETFKQDKKAKNCSKIEIKA